MERLIRQTLTAQRKSRSSGPVFNITAGWTYNRTCDFHRIRLKQAWEHLLRQRRTSCSMARQLIASHSRTSPLGPFTTTTLTGTANMSPPVLAVMVPNLSFGSGLVINCLLHGLT